MNRPSCTLQINESDRTWAVIPHYSKPPHAVSALQVRRANKVGPLATNNQFQSSSCPPAHAERTNRNLKSA